MNATTWAVLVLVFFGALRLTQVVVLVGAVLYEIQQKPWAHIRSFDDVLDMLTVRGWLAPPRRRPVGA